jgi:hypothetical protein
VDVIDTPNDDKVQRYSGREEKSDTVEPTIGIKTECTDRGYGHMFTLLTTYDGETTRIDLDGRSQWWSTLSPLHVSQSEYLATHVQANNGRRDETMIYRMQTGWLIDPTMNTRIEILSAVVGQVLTDNNNSSSTPITRINAATVGDNHNDMFTAVGENITNDMLQEGMTQASIIDRRITATKTLIDRFVTDHDVWSGRIV